MKLLGLLAATLASADPCADAPCQNYGTCAADPAAADGYICSCVDNYSGANCEITPCVADPCQNGATCLPYVDIDTSPFEGKYACSCASTAFYGDDCQNDPCTIEPCSNDDNGAACDVTGVDFASTTSDDYTCTCSDGFRGPTCELTVCTVDPSICNGGACTVVGDSYSCDCAGTNKIGTNCHLEDCVGSDIFAVTCLDDFKIKIDVVQPACFAQEYPTLTLGDLVVMANTETNDVDAVDTCKAYTGTGTGNNFVYSNDALSEAVDDTSSVLYFDGKVCSADAAFQSDTSILLYEAKMGTYIHDDDTDILFDPAMIAVPIKCKYTQSVDGPAVALTNSLVLDDPKKQGTNKVEGADDATTFIVTAAVSIEQADSSFAPLGENDSVMLGEKVKVTFTSSATSYDIHVASCIAQDDPATPVNTLALVTDDCFLVPSDANDALSFVEPTSLATAPKSGVAEMTMNQFAFIDNDAESNSESNPALVFHMKCKVEIGAATCADRRRRQAMMRDGDDDAVVIDVTYAIDKHHGNGEFEVDDGIVHMVETTSSSIANFASFGLFVFASFLFV